MRKSAIIVFFSLIFIKGFTSSSSIEKIDSLRAIINSINDDSVKIYKLLEISKLYAVQKDYENSLIDAKKAVELARRTNNKSYIYKAYHECADIYLKFNKYDTLITYLLNEFKNIDTATQKNIQALFYSNIAKAYYYKNEPYTAINYEKQSLKLNLAIKDSLKVIYCYQVLAVNYSNAGNFDLAVKYYLDALNYLKNYKNVSFEASVKSNIGITYIKLDKPLKGLYYLQDSRRLIQSLENSMDKSKYFNYNDVKLTNLIAMGVAYKNLNKLDSAEYFYNICIEEAEKQNLPITVMYAELNLANIFIERKEANIALLHVKKAHKIALKSELPRCIIGSTRNYGEVYFAMGKYNKAIPYFKDAIRLAEQAKELPLIDEISKFLYESYEKTSNYKLAYKTLLKHKEVSDSLLNEGKIKALTKAEMEYEFQQKEQEAARIVKERDLEQEAIIKKQKYQKNIAIISGGLILLIAGLGIFLIRLSQQKREHKLKESLYMNMQQTISQQMNPHFIFNTLNSIQNYIQKNKPEASMIYLSKFAELMRQVLNNSQDYIVYLDDELEFLKNYSDLEALRFENGFNFNVEIDKKINTSSLKIPVFLLQPLVENAIKHGLEAIDRQGMINLKVLRNNGNLKLRVEDNGIGIGHNVNLMPVEKHISVAHKLINKRLNILSLYYKKNFYFNIEDLKSDSGDVIGTVSEITMPLLQ